MKIKNVICSKGRTGFFFDDQRAIKNNATIDGASYKGTPCTEGFTSIRQAGESITIMLILDDGQIAYGDCAAVQYSGAAGRDPLFLAEDFIPIINKHIAPLLIGTKLESFKELAEKFDSLNMPNSNKKYHTAIRYGLTQALLDAVAKSKKQLMAQVVAEEYKTQLTAEELPIFTQSGDDRYNNVDKMIIKNAQVLPHGLINNVASKLGKNGELLLEYVSWLKNRVLALGSTPTYQPVLHIDVYGTIGLAFENDFDKMVAYFKKLEVAAHPLKLRIEGPCDVEEREAQMKVLRDITKVIDDNTIICKLFKSCIG